MADWDPFADPADESPVQEAAGPQVADATAGEPLPTELLGGQPSLRLSNGALMPVLGLGTWKSSRGEVKEAVLQAIELGYRHIDCARLYQNEAEVGAALKEAQARGLVQREELFITTKLITSMHGEAKVPLGFSQSMKALDCGYVDLYLIHSPVFPRPLPPLEDTWRGMERLVDEGKCRAIGVSNFSRKKLDQVLPSARIRPAVNQVELHPYLPQSGLVDFCRAQGIVVTAYSPLGSPDSAGFMGHNGPALLRDLTCTGPCVRVPLATLLLLSRVARRVSKSPAQVLLRWGLQRGTVVIPKSVRKERLAENLAVLDWELSPSDFQEICNIAHRERFLQFSDCCSEAGPFKSPIDIWDDPEGLPDL